MLFTLLLPETEILVQFLLSDCGIAELFMIQTVINDPTGTAPNNIMYVDIDLILLVLSNTLYLYLINSV